MSLPSSLLASEISSGENLPIISANNQHFQLNLGPEKKTKKVSETGGCRMRMQFCLEQWVREEGARCPPRPPSAPVGSP